MVRFLLRERFAGRLQWAFTVAGLVVLLGHWPAVAGKPSKTTAVQPAPAGFAAGRRTETDV